MFFISQDTTDNIVQIFKIIENFFLQKLDFWHDNYYQIFFH